VLVKIKDISFNKFGAIQ